jgi:hypothetical protein
MSVQFFQTRMGQRFYEHTMPELVRQITRLTDLLERLVMVQERRANRPPPPLTYFQNKRGK